MFPVSGTSNREFYPFEPKGSLTFEDGDSPYLTRTPTTAGNLKTWTFSCWIKRGNISEQSNIFNPYYGGDGSNESQFYFHSDDTLRIYDSGALRLDAKTSALFRDASAWYHIVLRVDTTQATDSDRLRIYVNGEEATIVNGGNGGPTYPTQNQTLGWNGTSAHYIGSYRGSNHYLDGYMAEVYHVDGASHDADTFAESKNGVWVPKDATGLTFGTNGFYLPFEDYTPSADITFDEDWADTGGWTSGGQGSFTTSSNTLSVSSYGSGSSFKGPNLKYTFDTQFTDFDFLMEDWIVGNSGNDLHQSYWYIYDEDDNIISGFGIFDSHADSSSNNHLYRYNGSTGTTLAAQTNLTVSGDWRIQRTGNQLTLTMNGYTTVTETANNTKPAAYILINARRFGSYAVPTQTFGQITMSGKERGFDNDQSGQANHFEAHNIQANMPRADIPTNNWCILDPNTGPNYFGTAGTFSNGNLSMVANNSVSSYVGADGTFELTSGKWYWETRIGANGSSFYPGVGIRDVFSGSIVHYRTQTQAYINSSPSGQTLSTYAAGDIIGIELDLDSATQTLQFYKNGSANGSTFSLTSGKTWIPIVGNRYASSTVTNFGQDSSFGRAVTAQGNADQNGLGDFYYSPSSGFLSLCAKNLPEPPISPLNGQQPADYFNTVLYTGNGSSQAITVGFAPDLVFVKNRGAVANGIINDTIRGAGVSLQTPSTAAETGSAGDLFDSLDSNGFTVNADFEGVDNPSTNRSANTYVAWNWLAGGTATSNDDGSITAQVSANTKAGFSICKWTGTGSNLTVGHGLGVAPKAYIVKRIDGTSSWHMYHDSLGAGKGIQLSGTGDQITLSTYWNSTAPTDSVFSIGTYSNVNTSSANYIAYVFAEVEGYCKIGSYTGNSSSDGRYLQCGFSPAFILGKSSSSAGDNWFIFDNKRDTENVAGKDLNPDSSAAEADNDLVDFTSNGFKWRSSSGLVNDSTTFIYIAFAEMPFKYAQAR